MSSVDKWFDDATTMINKVNTCEELQKAINHVVPGMNELLSKASADLTKLESLIVNVTDLPGAIQWINNFISMISSGYVKATAEVADITSHVAALTTVITNKIASLGCSGVTIP